MKNLIAQWEFWVAMAAAILLKHRASPSMGIGETIAAVITAVASALVFTQPIMLYLKLTGDTYAYAIAALVALSAEHLARQVLNLGLLDIIRAWRGSGGKK